jgi:methylenetetrahydrofolate dehydrogenase (NADP+)/methenyltetrahydrofolate cyclohydrolase
VAGGGRRPGLAVIIVGGDPASEIYVKNKIKACGEIGFYSVHKEMSGSITQEELTAAIEALNNDPLVDGILVQMPLPRHLDEKDALSRIDVRKDVDGFSAYQTGRLMQGVPELISCTPYGVMEMIKSIGYSVSGKNAVVIGRSNIVGKPMAMLLLNANATVTVCHSKTVNLKEITSKADILVAAIGRAKFVTADMVKEGALVIDVGINRVDGRLYGDVDYENVAPKAGYITPVPGGVGPMTIAMLMSNCLTAYKNSK